MLSNSHQVELNSAFSSLVQGVTAVHAVDSSSHAGPIKHSISRVGQLYNIRLVDVLTGTSNGPKPAIKGQKRIQTYPHFWTEMAAPKKLTNPEQFRSKL